MYRGASVTKQQQEARQSLAAQEERLYRSVERKLNEKTRPIDDMASSTNQYRQDYNREFMNSMMASARTNMTFKSIRGLALDRPDNLAFGYTNLRKSQHQVNPSFFKVQQNELEIENSVGRMRQADEQIQRLRMEVSKLEGAIAPTTSFYQKSTSNDYGRYLRPRP